MRKKRKKRKKTLRERLIALNRKRSRHEMRKKRKDRYHPWFRMEKGRKIWAPHLCAMLKSKKEIKNVR